MASNISCAKIPRPDYTHTQMQRWRGEGCAPLQQTREGQRALHLTFFLALNGTENQQKQNRKQLGAFSSKVLRGAARAVLRLLPKHPREAGREPGQFLQHCLGSPWRVCPAHWGVGSV